MSKSLKSVRRPLKGVRILVGRARHQASALSAELRKRGADVLEIPFIEISKPHSFRPLDSALKNLGTYDWLILTSVNGVEAMWNRIKRLNGTRSFNLLAESRRATNRVGHEFTGAAARSKGKSASAAGGRLHVAAIGPATKKALEQRGARVDIVPEQYVAESVVRSLKSEVKGKRVLLVRAKVARDVIPRELRKAGAHVDVVEAYETIVPRSSRSRLQAVLKDPKTRPNVVIFTSSSTVKNFVQLLGNGRSNLDGILISSIGPVTSATLGETGLRVDIAAKEFTIPGVVAAIVRHYAI